MAIIAVFNQKGGVGKTTTALNLLAGIARRGQRPWAVDLDPQGALSHLFGAHVSDAAESMVGFFEHRTSLDDIAQITRSGVIVCPAHAALADLRTRLGKGLDALTRLRRALRATNATTGDVVIDCASTRDALALNAIFASELVLIPVTCDADALRAALEVERTLNAVEKLVSFRQPRRYLLTRFDPDDRASESIAQHMVEALRQDEICATRIRECASLAECALDVFRHAPESTGAKDYEALVDELTRAGFVAATSRH